MASKNYVILKIENKDTGHRTRTIINEGFANLKEDIENRATKDEVNNIDNNRKGYFSTLEKLNKDFPNPENGWYAYIGETNTIWEVSNGKWINSGKPIPDDVDFSSYTKNGGSLKTLKEVDDQITPVFSSTSQLVDSTKFIKGHWLSDGTSNTAVNWIRTGKLDISDEIKGKSVTISGAGNVGGTTPVVIIWDANGNIIFTELGFTIGGSKTITVPANAYQWAFTVANVVGIGNTPQDNQFVASFMVNIGSTALSYMPMQMINPEMINSGNIKTPVNFSISPNVPDPSEDLNPVNKQTLDSTFSQIAKMSSQLVDTSKFVKGHWLNSGTSNTAVNWIRTGKLDIPETVKGKSVTISGAGNIGGTTPVVIIWDANGNIILTELGFTLGGSKTITVPANAYQWAFTVANVVGIGNTPQDNQFVTSFMVNIGSSSLGFESYGYIIDKSKIPSNIDSKSSYNEYEIILKKDSTNTFSIYYHTKGADNNIWLRIGLIHATNNDKFTEVWRLNVANIAERTGDLNFVTLLQVIQGGVWENAIYTSGYGYTDALGSAHGWEITDEFHVFVDGKDIDLTQSSIAIKGTSFYMTSVSKFKSPDGIANVGQSTKRWDITDGILTINNKIDWHVTMQVGGAGSYLSMLPVNRKTSDNIQVSEMATANDLGIIYDVSEEGFVTPVSITGGSAVKPTPNRNRLTIWGNRFKASMIVTLRNPDLGNSYMFVQNTFYNKLYGSFGSTTVNNGDKWECTTQYDIRVY